MNKTRELTDLTACRALFALWVFAYHVNLHAQFSHWFGPLGIVIDHGYLGVDGFFVLSGYILARVDAKIPLTRPGLLHFWGKRLARLYPVHLAVILLLVVIFLGGIAIGLTPRQPDRFGTMALIDNLLLIQSWGTLNHWTWNYPSWSISTEWAGYLLFPFIAASFSRFFNLAIVAAMPLCFFILCVVSFEFHGLNLTFAASLLRFFPEFIAGMATAIVVPMFADEWPGARIGLIGALAAAAAAWGGHDALTVFGIWLMIYGLAMQGDAEKPAYLGRIKPLRFIGIISYPLYMSFAPAELVTSQLFRRLHHPPASVPLAYAGMLMGLTFGLGLLLHVLIEKPARVALNRRLDPERAQALAEGTVPL
ncbi:acyltransferase family protein [Acidiphilium sp.]|uniref:acyltransferase family protein n=1 Tax=Acidiphilium sp. TaxID=527 RepID=UPI003CFCDFFA